MYILIMPDVKVYIRTEDLDTWNSIEKKSEFIHNALNNIVSVPVAPPRGAPPKIERISSETTISIPGVSKGSDFVPKPPDPETGYPCCLGKRPCKHWVWNGDISAYVNSLTGKEREVI
jgi:hypothetical protein